MHQLEEYRFPGNFPILLNRKFFKSTIPDRYPLNTQSAFVVNVCFGWAIYLLAILFADKLIWLAIASFVVSIGNMVMHTFVFNMRAKTFYNPGMITALIFFLPISIWFFFYIQSHSLVKPSDYFIGIILGVIVSYLGILKVIDWFKDKNTKFVFSYFNLASW